MKRVVCLFACALTSSVALASMHSFEYVGELARGGEPVDGMIDLRLRWYDGPQESDAIELAAPFERGGVLVRAGRFRVAVELDPELLTAHRFWVGLEVAEVGTGAYVSVLRRDRVELATAELTEAPVSAVVFFSLAACPIGWTEHTPARGRSIVGLPSGGTLGGTLGSVLGNLAAPEHTHSISAVQQTAAAGEHSHVWSSGSWNTFDATGTPVALPNHISDGAGTSVYPIASPEFPASNYTDGETAHPHAVPLANPPSKYGGLPYLQLLACRKL